MANAGFKQGNVVESQTTTATSGSTLTLTSSSDAYQVFTGSQNHTVKLPDATTMVVNQRFEIVNTSTGIITIQNNGSVVQATVAAGETKIFRATDISTANGVFDATSTPSSGAGGLSTTEALQFSNLADFGFSATSRTLKINPEEVGGEYWLSKTSMPVAKATDAFNLNGFAFAVGGYFGSAETNSSYRYNDDANTWLARNNITVAKYDAVTFVINGFGYHVSGQTNAAGSGLASGNSYKYTDSTDTWTAVTDINTPCRSGGGGSFDLGYVVGGYNGSLPTSNKVQSYNPTSNAWILYSNVLPSTLYLPASFSNKEHIYVAGGSNGAVTLSSTYAWNTIFNNALTKFPMNAIRQTTGAANLGFGFAAGGYNGSYIATSEKYYFDNNFWMNISSRSNAVQTSPCGGTSLNSILYIFGAYGPSTSAVVESYTSYSFYYLDSLKRSTAAPSSVKISVNLNGLTTVTPVQLRTDGDNWKNFLSNGTALKQAETLVGKFQNLPELYWVGGSAGSGTNNAKFDDNLNSWLARQVIASSHSGGTAFAIEGKSYLATGKWGGSPTTDVARYDSLTNVWSFAPPAATAFYQADPTGWTLNGLGYVAGGESADALNNHLNQYNATTDAWTLKANASQAHRRATGFQLFNQLGYLGNSIVATTTRFERYVPELDAWSNMADLPNRRDNSAGASLSSKGYMIGGSDTGGSANAQSSTYEYDSVSNAWSTKTALDYNVMFVNGQSSNDSVFIAGGLSSGGSDLNNVRKFVPSINTWSTRTGMLAAGDDAHNHPPGPYRNYEVRVGIPAFYAGLGGLIWNLTTGILPNSVNADGGSGMAIQGFGYLAGTVSPATTTTQKYNESSNSAITYISMNIARYNAGAFSLHGVGYVYHGVGNPSSSLTSAEKLDVVTNSWTNLTNPGVTSGNDTAQGASLNGFGYILGGDIGVATSQWNDATSTWTTKANNPAASLYGRCSVNGYIYSISGTSTYRYNDGANTWTSSVATLSTSPSDPSILVYNNSAISVTSGATEKLNDATLVWSRVQAPSQSTDGNGFFTLSNGFALGRSVDCLKLTDSIKQAVLSAGLTVS